MNDRLIDHNLFINQGAIVAFCSRFLFIPKHIFLSYYFLVFTRTIIVVVVVVILSNLYVTRSAV